MPADPGKVTSHLRWGPASLHQHHAQAVVDRRVINPDAVYEGATQIGVTYAAVGLAGVENATPHHHHMHAIFQARLFHFLQAFKAKACGHGPVLLQY